MQECSSDCLGSGQAQVAMGGGHHCSCSSCGGRGILELRPPQHLLHLPRRLLQHGRRRDAVQLQIGPQHACCLARLRPLARHSAAAGVPAQRLAAHRAALAPGRLQLLPAGLQQQRADDGLPLLRRRLATCRAGGRVEGGRDYEQGGQRQQASQGTVSRQHSRCSEWRQAHSTCALPHGRAMCSCCCQPQTAVVVSQAEGQAPQRHRGRQARPQLRPRAGAAALGRQALQQTNAVVRRVKTMGAALRIASFTAAGGSRRQQQQRALACRVQCSAR